MDQTAPANMISEQNAPAQTPAAPANAVNESTVIPKTPVDKFKEGYDKLVADTGMMISVEPVYFRRDDGSYSTIIRTSIVPRT